MPLGDCAVSQSQRLLFVLRGTPGLGRVVASVELARSLEESFRVKCFFVTYGNGLAYLESLHAQCAVQVDRQDIMSLGIQPVSTSAERILESIKRLRIDCVVVDGEPLMVLAIKVGLPNLPVVSMMNPSDYCNAQLPASTIAFFRFCYGASDYRIVHGLERVAAEAGNALSTSTIIRREVLALSSAERPNVVSVVFGGGTACATNAFYESCRKFFDVVLAAARFDTNLVFKVFLSGAEFPCQEGDVPANVLIMKDIATARDVYDCEVVVARAGRNTISEILFLGKKAVLFSVLGEHRSSEQQRNAALAWQLGRQAVSVLKSYDSTMLSAEIRQLQRASTPDYHFSPGNAEALRFISLKMQLFAENAAMRSFVGGIVW
jgi:hypothetical protein